MNSENTPHRAVHHAPPATARRALLRGLAGAVSLGGGLALATTPASAATPHTTTPRPGTAEEALRELAAGNRRWRTYCERHPDETPAVRQSLTAGQQPFAVVLGCIDSRVPPELLFDTGFGDLFVMRTGGQVVGPVVTGSVEYGPMTSGTPLIVVLGHQRCGAIKASYKALKDNKPH